MKAIKPASLITGILVICFLLPASTNHAAADPAESTGKQIGVAELSLIEGMASLLDAKDKPIRTLAKGDRCRPGDRIRTGNKARLTLTFKDGSRIRFSEFATFELVSLEVTESPKARNIRIRILTGNAWVNEWFRAAWPDNVETSLVPYRRLPSHCPASGRRCRITAGGAFQIHQS